MRDEASRDHAFRAREHRLRTLGRLALLAPDGIEESSLASRPRKLAVLTWLALLPDRVATRDRLVGIFWGDRDEEHARNSLSDALSHIRRVLGRDAIRSVGEEVRLVPDAPLSVDVLLLAEAAARKDHQTVVDLYKGPFLDGVHIERAHAFDDWCERTRAAVATTFARAAAARCRSLAVEGRWDECRTLAERWLEAEPASAECACLLMDAIASPGTSESRAAALAVYGALVRRLDRDLGIPPAAAVRQRALDITREQSPDASPSAAPSLAVSNLPTMPTRTAAASSTRSGEDMATPRGTSAPVMRRRAGARRIAGVIAGVALFTVAVALYRDRSGARPSLDPRRVVVAEFEDRTDDTTFARLGRAASEWMTRGLVETRALDVVHAAPSRSGRGEPRRIGREAGAGSVVVGSYERHGDSLLFEARIVDANDGHIVRAIRPVVADPRQPLAAIDHLREQVAGTLAAQRDSLIPALAPQTSEPPTYAAYLAWIEGLELFAAQDLDASIAPFMRAASADSTFVTPLVWAAAAHGNLGRWLECDSLIRLADRRRSHLAPFDRALLDFWIATIHGDHAGRYTAAHVMLDASPGSELGVFLAGATAVEVLRVEEGTRLLRRIPVERSAVPWDRYGRFLAWAHHLAHRYDDEVIEARRRRAREPRWLPAMLEEGRALAAAGRTSELRQLTAEITTVASLPNWTAGSTLLGIAQEALVHGHHDAAIEISREVSAWVQARPDSLRRLASTRLLVASSLALQGEWDRADATFLTLQRATPTDPELLGWLGVSAARRGDVTRALQLSARLESLDVPYLHGAHTLARARIAVALGRRKEAIALLRRAMAEGVFISMIHVVPEVVELEGDPEYEALVRVVG